MTTMNISLPEAMKESVDREVAAGGFSTASEYVRQLIRDDLARKEQRRVEALLLAGLESDDAGELTPEAWVSLRRHVHRRLAERGR